MVKKTVKIINIIFKNPNWHYIDIGLTETFSQCTKQYPEGHFTKFIRFIRV